MKVTLLGCGSSQGVPVIGNRWGNCDPDNPKNRRSRPSIHLQTSKSSVLIDMAPDVRTQFLDNEISRLDAVLFTHLHYDHIAGIGELRSLSYSNQKLIEVFATRSDLSHLTARWRYLFHTESLDKGSNIYPAVASAKDFTYGETFSVGDIEIIPFKQDHGVCATAGFRFGDFAYSTDVVTLDETAFSVLKGTKVWIVDCLREQPHPTHAHLARTLSWIEKVQPRQAILTHMNFQADYEDLKFKCPAGVEPGYDGMTIEYP